MKNKVLFILLGLLVVTGPLVMGGWLVLRSSSRSDFTIERPRGIEINQINETNQNSTATDAPVEPIVERVLLDVPFTSQAPSAEWSNIIFQQGCEEASMLMAMFWARGKQITPSAAEKEIETISSFEQKNYGESRDTSAKDTAEIMKDYFDYQNVEVKNNVTSADIKRELRGGNVVIVPVNGQKVGSPFYTSPGPIQHMLVVRGYDAPKKEFIVNDPGTRRGEAVRYNEDILEAALQDYVTGYKEPITTMNKVMIVVSRRP